ncbi:penicillin acylase family protein [Acanthopleuribacter pedis]|uniref:Penicillin acylase family protein n=1 Tax=Acanthopleuribacter pedis TaxID=442870 RepID=A0A8J7Q7I9_9BACT|nr:penicillin acylase family protein [Acanthopleuribacter pedis]MBO1318259.1 penicillin acylase family protein [Acanthopleuribacter pedis]
MSTESPSVAASPPAKRRRWLRRLLLPLLSLVVLIVAVVLFAVSLVRGSLPDLDGTLVVAGLEQPVTILRDDQGVPTIEAQSRADALFALGFLHGQERFFQMDLLRRSAGGRLSELFGAAALKRDRSMRRHQFHATVAQVVRDAPREQRELLEVYAQGVNRGLAELDQVPFEYLLLRVEPQPWRVEDSLMTLATMFVQLQGGYDRAEYSRGVLHHTMGPEMTAFVAQWGSRWDAANLGEPYQPPAPPAPEVVNLRRQASLTPPPRRYEDEVASLIGSNNWAVGGALTQHGRALVADDMHLGIDVPNTWYRADLTWPASDAPDGRRRVTGVSLPGTPAIIAGSNGEVAWGFTNSYGDWTDLVVVEPAPGDETHYLTPDGPRAFDEVVAEIPVKGGEPETFRFQTTLWGPIVGEDHLKRKLALRWVGHEARALNMNLLGLMNAPNAEQALAVAKTVGIPAQNMVLGDKDGAVAWTIAGQIPRKFGDVGWIPQSWADGSRGWDGWLPPEDYPVILRPDHHRIWTANARVLDMEQQKRLLGNGSYALGPRAAQIRDRLFEKETFTEADLFAIQRDHEARYHAEWRAFLLAQLDEAALADSPMRAEYRELIEQWSGFADPEDVGYYLVRAFRVAVVDQVSHTLTAPAKAADEKFSVNVFRQRDGMVWTLLQAEPLHLLPAEFASWRDYNLSIIDAEIARLTQDDEALSAHTWGRHNRVQIQHPFSSFMPRLASWLDMPEIPLKGDSNMPLVQRGKHGASQRMVVAPGLEAQGIMQMPGGQSGHPLSPYYRAGHEAWAHGEITPFLPGPTRHRLNLMPD